MEEKYVDLDEEKVVKIDKRFQRKVLDNYFKLRSNTYIWSNPNCSYLYHSVPFWYSEIKNYDDEKYLVTIFVTRITKHENEDYYRIHSLDNVVLNEHFKNGLDFNENVIFADMSNELLELMNELRERTKPKQLHLTYIYKKNKNKFHKHIVKYDRSDKEYIREHINDGMCCTIL